MLRRARNGEAAAIKRDDGLTLGALADVELTMM
ncbi:hypothetical protein Poly21_54080 [Allorhodopirellula heiligendammensis]|uniref:Uncharacterized protein n=1 Tax=Allorhodopirellula heiligendammensis TaxID=2714739 RepID=A0A5C6BEF3_9BACT|nr:hypothetical protein Poly21_54080 [Allorhodopirellula heiligendammensis]